MKDDREKVDMLREKRRLEKGEITEEGGVRRIEGGELKEERGKTDRRSYEIMWNHSLVSPILLYFRSHRLIFSGLVKVIKEGEYSSTGV